MRGARRLGAIGKIRAPKPATAPPLDPVAKAAKEMQVRLTKEQRQALIRRPEDDDQ